MAHVFEQENNFIIILKKQHGEILSRLNNFSPLLSGKSFSDINCMVTLRELKKLLVEHLSLEDKELYPTLKRSRIKEIRETGRKFSDRMQTISKKVFDFFNKYSSMQTTDLSSSVFKKSLRDVKESIEQRVKIEEEVLYPLYEKSPLMTEKEKKEFA
jgi:regulator of sigma D